MYLKGLECVPTIELKKVYLGMSKRVLSLVHLDQVRRVPTKV